MDLIKTEAEFEEVRAANRGLVRARLMQKGIPFDDIDDVEQLVWMEVWRERKRENDLAVRGYLWVKAQDAASRYYENKRTKKRSGREVVLIDRETKEPLSLDIHQDYNAVDPEAMACLLSLATKLFRPYREALLLWISDHSYDEIGVIMNVSHASISYYLSEARRGIYELMKTGKIGPDPRLKNKELTDRKLCRRGLHEWIPENLYWDKSAKSHRCKQCRLRTAAARYKPRPRSRSTVCPNGHEMSDENTYHPPMNPSNWQCRICRHDNVKRNRAIYRLKASTCHDLQVGYS